MTDKDAGTLPDCLNEAEIIRLPKGARIFTPGDSCNQFFYLLEGVIRVDLIARSGKAITLYRFGASETCILTTSCLLSGEDYCAEAHVEEPVKTCIVPFAAFETGLNQSAEFRHLVFSSFAQRLSAMMGKIEEVAFTPIDTRLAARVLELNASNKIIHVTHEQLAADLGTAREVISRKFAQWEKTGMIERARGSLRVLNTQKLERMAELRD